MTERYIEGDKLYNGDVVNLHMARPDLAPARSSLNVNKKWIQDWLNGTGRSPLEIQAPPQNEVLSEEDVPAVVGSLVVQNRTVEVNLRNAAQDIYE